MHSKSDKIEIKIYDKVDDAIQEPFESLFSRYQIELETSIKSSNFIFDCFNLLHYKCCLINLKFGGSYIDFLDRVKSKKATINPYKW